MANILIMTHWTDGDVVPFIRMGKELCLRNHNVTLFTHKYYEEHARAAGLDFVAIDTIEEYHQMMQDMVGDIDSVLSDTGISAYRAKYESIEKRLQEYKLIAEYCTKEDTIIIAKNRSSLSAFLAAEKFDIPIVSVFMAPYEVYSMLNFQEIYGEKILDEMNELRSRVELPPVRTWLEWQSSPDYQIGLWPKWFSEDTLEEWPAPIVPIGFPLDINRTVKVSNMDQRLQDILNGEQKPIIITGGTSRMLRNEFYPACVEVCGEMNVPTILLTKYKELVPKDLPKNVEWFSHIPLDSVMPYIGAIIHHGGIGTTGGALYAGVPQLVLGHFVDRPYNGMRVKELGVGEYLPPIRWKKNFLQKAISKILSDDTKAKCEFYSQKMLHVDVMQEVCNFFEKVLSKKKEEV